MTEIPNDPLFPTQWGLQNREQAGGTPGIDVDAVPVWPDYTGKGVRVGVVDEGVQLDHPDLIANMDIADSWDGQYDKLGGGPTTSGENHGTTCAGIIGAVANNGIGGSGVAPDATLISYRMPLGHADSLGNDSLTAATIDFTKALQANVDVLSNSWGNSAAFANNFRDPGRPSILQAPVVALGTDGRAGMGAIIVVANGNDRAPRFDGNLDNFHNNRFVIAVGALDNNGVASAYSTPGADLLVAAPGGGSTNQIPTAPGNAITTADRTGADGYNPTPGADGDYTYDFNGTSAATPFVSGVAALMLQANPDLGYRDVQQILAYTARRTDPSASNWTETHATDVNGGGAHFSTDYGFGLVDARAAVRLAESYKALHAEAQTEANLAVLSAPSDSGPVDLLPGVSFDYATPIHFTVSPGVTVNHLDLTLDLINKTTSQMAVQLTSPSGTTETLFNAPQNASAVDVDPDDEFATNPWPAGGFTLGTNAFWGEDSGGTWTLKIATGNGLDPFATFNSATLQVEGGSDTGSHEYTYTDDFAAAAAQDPSRLTLRAALGDSGNNTLNAAAVSTAITVDVPNERAVIGGQTISIASDIELTTIVGGDGDDTLIGGKADTRFMAGRGINVVEGGGGSNTALFTGARAGYSLGLAADGITIDSLDDATKDTLSGVQHLDFDDGTFDISGALGGSIVVGDSGAEFGKAYSGPVDYLKWQFLAAGSKDLIIAADVPNAFLRGGAGSDAITALSGNNVLDGGGGSDWLVGAAGSDGGHDTFFLSDLLTPGGQTNWDTIQNFHVGDVATIWGYDPSKDQYSWSDGQGAAGHEGATLTISPGGGGAAVLMTLDGVSTANASLGLSTGVAGSTSYLSVTRLG